MTSKLLLIEATTGYYEEDYDGVEIHTREININQLADESVRNYEIRSELHTLVTNVLEKAKSGDAAYSDLVAMLRAKGWVNIDAINEREEKVKVDKKFYLHDGYHFDEIDLNNINQITAGKLADDKTHVFQSISKTSVKALMGKEAKRVYDSQRNYAEKQKERRAAAKKKQLEKKQAREIAKAKAILAKHDVG